jgi:hypothetical protein
MKKTRSAPNGAKHSPATTQPPVGAYKLKPAAQYIGGLSVPTMHRLIQRGLLKPCRATRHLLFTRVELDRFLTSNMT